VWSLYLYV